MESKPDCIESDERYVESSVREKPKGIQAIKKKDVHQICSGQVVLNLAIAVKELVENSLDAGATTIEVRLKEYGSKLIEVVDNGWGVEESNFQGLTLKHHTSKLQEFSDLVSVETFGFRGEALSSLCALSEMTIITRHKDVSCGSKLEFDHNGKIVNCTPFSRQVGTSVIVCNLFGTLPVRQKEFHRNLRREFTKMTQLLYAYCLVSVNVKITCSNQLGKGSRNTVVCTQGCSTVRENISCVFGSKQVQTLMVVSSDEDIFSIEGHVSSCSHGQGRAASDRQFYYINSRPCEPNKLMKLVNEVYRTYNVYQYPFVFLNLKMRRTDVDVNVTPDKRQVFLEHEKEVLLVIRELLLKLYESVPSTFQFQNVPSQSFTPRSQETPSPNGTGTPIPLSAMFSNWKAPNSKRGFEERKPSKGRGLFNYYKRLKSDDSVDTENIKFSCNGKIVTGACVEKLPKSADTSVELKHSTQVMDCSEILFEDSECFVRTGEHAGALEEHFLNSTQEHCVDVKRLDSGPSNSNDTKCSIEDVQPSTSLSENIQDIKDRGLTSEVYEETVEVGHDSGPSNSNDTRCSIEDVQPSTSLSENIQDIKDRGLTSEVYEETVEVDSEKSLNFQRQTVWSSVTLDDIRSKLVQVPARRTVSETVVRFRAGINPAKNQSAEQELVREISKDMFTKMHVIGQFNLGFIITRLDQDLFIIDQHASDEKYNFETLQQKAALSNQRLVCPLQLDVSATGESVLLENIQIFRSNGFEFTIDEQAEVTKKVTLTAIPVSRMWEFGKEDIDELIFMLQDAPGTMCRPSRVRAMFASRACRKSVMIGTALSMSKMRRLVNNMGTIEQPWNCPHGRPTMRHLVNLNLLQS